MAPVTSTLIASAWSLSIVTKMAFVLAQGRLAEHRLSSLLSRIIFLAEEGPPKLLAKAKSCAILDSDTR